MDKKLKILYTELLASDYCGRSLYERIRDRELTCAPHFKGEEFEGSPLNLMIVGRAMNGWETNFSDCNSPEALAESVLQLRQPFEDIVAEEGIPCKGRSNYFYQKSNFWKLTKALLDAYGEARPGIWKDENFPWHQKVVWSNLYKVSPWGQGNPSWAQIKPFMANYIEIIRREIEILSPKHILFITDLNYFDPWKKQPSFSRNLLGELWRPEAIGCIVGTGQYNKSKIIICKRPDRWGISDQKIKDMAKEIQETFKKM